MTYDPIRDAPAFRATLRRLSDVERLTSQSIVDIFNRNRARGDNMSISRATLDRFAQGEHITKIRELRAIHDLLRGHPAYGRYFEPVTDEPAPPGAPLVGEDAAARDGPLPDDARIAMPGAFILMRRDHDRVSLENGVRVSTLTLAAADSGVSIQETQSHCTPDGGVPFEQTDRGNLFAHGPLMYFLMKEIGGTAVKFGVIELMLPDLERRHPVQYFEGYLMVASRRGVFPRTRFAARRYSPDTHKVTSGIVRLEELSDPRAAEHLRPDFAANGAWRMN